MILVISGLVALVGQFADFSGFEDLGFLFLPALGTLFMRWGIPTRQAGPMVPDSILSGIGWGSYLATGRAPTF